MSEVHYRELINDALDDDYGGLIEELEELEAIIEAANDVIETGRDEVRLEAEVFDRREWDKLAAPYVEKANAPWLKKFKENGVEVVRKLVPEQGKKTFLAQEATSADLEVGVFADSLDTYNKLTGRAA